MHPLASGLAEVAPHDAVTVNKLLDVGNPDFRHSAASSHSFAGAVSVASSLSTTRIIFPVLIDLDPRHLLASLLGRLAQPA